MSRAGSWRFASLARQLCLQDGIPLGWRGTTIAARTAALVHAFAEKSVPLPPSLAQAMLRILDRLVHMGDRRSAALQISEVFNEVRVQGGPRSSNQACSEPSICTSSPRQSRRRRG
jgi:hypothetical protein